MNSKKIATKITIVMLACLPFALPVVAQNEPKPIATSATVLANIDGLERALFASTNSDKAPEARLGKLEKFVFGVESAGDIEKRIERLWSTVGVSRLEQAKESKASVSETAQNPIPEKVAGSTKNESPLSIRLSDYVIAGDPNVAMRDVDYSLKSEGFEASRFASLYFQRAKIRITLRDFKRAVEDIDRAISYDPNQSNYYLARAAVHYKLDETLCAVRDIQQARFAGPNLPSQIVFEARQSKELDNSNRQTAEAEGNSAR